MLSKDRCFCENEKEIDKKAEEISVDKNAEFAAKVNKRLIIQKQQYKHVQEVYDKRLTNSENTILASLPNSLLSELSHLFKSVEQFQEEINLSQGLLKQLSKYRIVAKKLNKDSNNMCASLNFDNMSTENSIAEKLAQLFKIAYSSEMEF
ncbi:7974_t:CDS:2 [Dentiscutata erythropus]|uniref:7974_t:CDS:1 n=1 Tax=Dentiscutata erythropus TaxID=1348616 RepID=A0A9N9IWU3_9GLOM|nr:7974_t:CDS:2 [Dentiscutata erythropus]